MVLHSLGCLRGDDDDDDDDEGRGHAKRSRPIKTLSEDTQEVLRRRGGRNGPPAAGPQRVGSPQTCQTSAEHLRLPLDLQRLP